MAYINTTTKQYPLSERDIKQLFHNTSFPKPFNPEGYAVVFPSPQPTYDQDLQSCVEGEPFLTDKGTWEQTWSVSDINFDSEQLQVVFDRVKKAKLESLASTRFTKETAGITLNGSAIKTDRESQATMTGAWVTVQQNPTTLIDWKSDTGWIQIDKATVEALSSAVAAHVQACFAAEKTHSVALDSLTTVQEIKDYDLITGWPIVE